MGRMFVDQIEGQRIIICNKCDIPLTNNENLQSTNFQGSTGKAFLFKRVINLKYSEVQERHMISGKHYVRDVYCKGCNEKIGWMYEFACLEKERHKEGKVILEKVFIKESK